jgi:predicted DNA-binding transcriptional regulator YafY
MLTTHYARQYQFVINAMTARSKTAASSLALLHLAILNRLSRHRSATVKDIHESLVNDGWDVQNLTVRRALNALKDNPEFGVVCDESSKPYGYRLAARPMMARDLSPTESLLLQMARNQLRYQLPANLLATLTPLFDLAGENLFDSPSARRQREWLEKISVLPNHMTFIPPKILTRIFETATNALYNGKKLRITYKGRTDKQHVVSPLGLVQQDVRLYLVCRFEGYDNIRHLALHRISSAEMLDFPADVPPGFRLSDYLRQCIFNYADETDQMVRLSFEVTNPNTVTNLTETPFNKTQRIEEVAPGIWRIQVDLLDSRLIDGWLATWKKVGGIQNVSRTPLENPARE